MPTGHNKTGRSKRGPPFAMVLHWVMDTAAFRSLSPQAVAVYLVLLRIYNGSNNGSIALSARNAAERCNIAKDTATRAFRELIEKGFIELVTAGSFNLKLPHAAEYRLTHVRCDKTAGLPTKAFLRWQPPSKA